MPVEGLLDERDGAHQRDRGVQPPRRGDRAIDDGRWRVIAAHRIDRYAHARFTDRLPVHAPPASTDALLLVDRPDLAFAIVAAMRADAMRSLGLPALRARPCRHRGERVVRAPLRGAGL
jgi:hypothetical protein